MGFPAVAHVAVTVTDLGESRRWYRRLLGSDPVLDEPVADYHHVVFALTGGTLFALHHHPDGEAGRFDHRRPGLDHVAFGVADRERLQWWMVRLEELGVTHGGIVDEPYGSGLSFRDPDGIALELFAPPGDGS